MTGPFPPRVAAAPLALSAGAWDDYALIDSGDGRKLERFGAVTAVRPEPQCLWRPGLAPEVWDAADAVFEGRDDEDQGRWTRKSGCPDAWPMRWGEVCFEARLTAFRHLGLFPEQAANWDWIGRALSGAPRGARVLNLFGYTGVATLVAASHGAQVTHVDASRKSVAWARENARMSGLDGAPIRWLTEDARTYVRRELRRGAKYDAIILDPPKYGRGPDGDVWRLYQDLPDLLVACAALLSDTPLFLLLNAYSERLTGLALAHLLAEVMAGRGGGVDWGELALIEARGARGVGLSFFARWSAA